MNNQNFADALWSQGPIPPQMPVLDDNLIMNTDSYKPSHFLFLPDYTEHMSWYLESRGVASDRNWNKAMFFGLQMLMKEYLSKPITQEMIEEAQDMLPKHGVPFNLFGWETILDEYGGYLPLQIDAAPEGLVFPTSNAMLRVVNTDPRFPWLPGYTEKMFVQGIWYTTTVATLSWHIKQTIKEFLLKTTDGDIDGKLNDLMWQFRLHDFGGRGCSSLETSGLGGIAHLVNFRGTDTMEALRYGRKYYYEEMAGYSIPATEHSIVLAHQSEYEAYHQVISIGLAPGKMAGSVSDTTDLWRTIDWYGTRLKKKIIDSGGTLVVRPDSGEPVEIVVAVVKRLMYHFGFTTNSKGYDVLPPYIRVLQGDGVNEDSIRDILEALVANNLSTENVTFGMGGQLLQGVNRDTLKFAMKPSAIWERHAREWRGVSKDPITDPGKRSKMGRLSLVYENGEFQTVDTDYVERDKNRVDLLRPVFRNGEILVEHTFNRIRARSEAPYC